MKTAITTTVLFIAVVFMTSCGSNNKKAKESATEQVETAKYQCPMKCEGDKTYEKTGTCPVCNMDLELVSEKEHHNH